MAVVMFFASGPLPAAQAAMVSTEQVIDQDLAAQDRGRVLDFLAREEVRQQIEALGVDPDEAAARVRALSDAEIAQIAAGFDEDPAGQSVIGPLVGAAVLIFLVLLITDLLCLTTVFSFTKCAKN
ncbi:MAG: PA2779 family protein [Kiloniellales bacterium]